MSQDGKQTITMHILPDISRSKGNQTMKFGQLIEYNIRNIFLMLYSIKIILYYIFSKSQHWGYFWICFYCMLKSTTTKIYWKYKKYKIQNIRCWLLAFTSYAAFLKNKKWSLLVFCMVFKKKISHVRYTLILYDYTLVSPHKKWSFSLRISSVNVTNSTDSCGFGHTYWRNP